MALSSIGTRLYFAGVAEEEPGRIGTYLIYKYFYPRRCHKTITRSHVASSCNSPRPSPALSSKIKHPSLECWCALCVHGGYNVFFRHLIRISLLHFHCSLQTAPLLKQSWLLIGTLNSTYFSFFFLPFHAFLLFSAPLTGVYKL